MDYLMLATIAAAATTASAQMVGDTSKAIYCSNQNTGSSNPASMF